MTDARRSDASPALGDLIGTGVAYAKTAKATGLFVALAAGATLPPAIVGRSLGGVFSLACAIAALLISVRAAREAILGDFSGRETDVMATLRLAGACALAIVGVIVIGAPAIYVFAGNAITALAVSIVLFLAAIAALARLAFLPPSLALNDGATWTDLVARSRPHWAALALLVGASVAPAAVAGTMFGASASLFGLAIRLAGAAASAFVSLVAIGAISRLYAGKA